MAPAGHMQIEKAKKGTFAHDTALFAQIIASLKVASKETNSEGLFCDCQV